MQITTGKCDLTLGETFVGSRTTGGQIIRSGPTSLSHNCQKKLPTLSSSICLQGLCDKCCAVPKYMCVSSSNNYQSVPGAFIHTNHSMQALNNLCTVYTYYSSINLSPRYNHMEAIYSTCTCSQYTCPFKFMPLHDIITLYLFQEMGLRNPS